MAGEGVEGEAARAANGEGCCRKAEDSRVLQAAFGGEKAVGGVHAGGNAHGGGRRSACSRSAKSEGQGQTGACFPDAGKDSAGLGRPEPHGVHAFAGALDPAPAEPAEELLGSVGNEDAAEAHTENGLGSCGGGRCNGAGARATHLNPPVTGSAVRLNFRRSGPTILVPALPSGTC